ncbi:toprim domain-containing protein [Ktedonospora formicarum]|uniref:Toprim domain-containing protein n=1 Tax=Ktedonospora formicarum TaxID=2778364 RepID=A0A8J3HWK1_9CHLR|nr:toprim domain-containing protein [Ktedonospora formicarum]GHO44556.1 hypothetical protein KSX_27190 [Ktedonospora formicarum]
METLAYLLELWDGKEGEHTQAAVNKAIKVASKYTVENIDAYRQRVEINVRKEPMNIEVAKMYREVLFTTREHRLVWLLERGLTRDTIYRAGLGHAVTTFTIPLFDHTGKLLTIRHRRDDYYGTETWKEDEDGDEIEGTRREKSKYSGTHGRNGLFLYGEFWLPHWKEDYLVVVESELDALLLIQKGIPAVSPTNGAGNLWKVPKLLRQFDFTTHFKRLFICSDMDEPGEAGARQLAEAAPEQGFTTERIRWELEQGKDVTEYHQHGYTLDIDRYVYGRLAA